MLGLPRSNSVATAGAGSFSVCSGQLAPSQQESACITPGQLMSQNWVGFLPVSPSTSGVTAC